MDRAVKIESKVCAVVLQLCLDLLLRINKHKIMDREIIFEKSLFENLQVYTKMHFALRFQNRRSVHASEIGLAWQNFQESVTNLSAFSNNFLKSKENDTFLMA